MFNSLYCSEDQQYRVRHLLLAQPLSQAHAEEEVGNRGFSSKKRVHRFRTNQIQVLNIFF